MGSLIVLIMLIVDLLLASIFIFSNLGKMGKFKNSLWIPIEREIKNRMRFLMTINFILFLSSLILLFKNIISSQVSLLSIIVFGGIFIFFLFKLMRDNQYFSKSNKFYNTIYMASLFLVTIDVLLSFYNL
ncbi:hypothetical protein CPT_MarsHill_242 [Staphylococcus phage MarsHill]|nr:hypothetical protein CPT_MarsHill_242 [Staphylococcus phage MarsHill]